MQTSKADGMLTMDHSLVNLVREGKISYETARPYVHDESTHNTLQQLDRSPSRMGSMNAGMERNQMKDRGSPPGGQGIKVN